MVFNRLDWLEERLADRRYLFGDKITESDVRLYVTLARFDVAYHNIFRVNKKRLRDYDNLWAMQETCIRHRDSGIRQILRQSKSIITLTAILEIFIRSLQKDRMKKRGCFHMEERSFQKNKKAVRL